MTSIPAKDEIVIALDAMGGDLAPQMVLDGAILALAKYPDIKFIIHGNRSEIEPFIKKSSPLSKASSIVHSSEVVSNDDKPSVALRQRRNSSMAMAVKSVRSGEAAAMVSSGNTGALMAISKVLLRTLPGIDRPAIGTVLPTKRGNSVMLDLGANVICDGNNLFEFAVMGDAFARSILGYESPSIGLLNIGTEEMKGNEAVKEASIMLKESTLDLNFHGHIEGDDIGKGLVDVIVTDGFSGNIALKTAEGTAKMLFSFLKDAINSSWISKIGALLAKPAFSMMMKKFDPRMHNGAMLMGLNGIVVKSHGGTDEIGFANAIAVSVELVKHKINEQIMREMVQSGHIVPDEEIWENKNKDSEN